jgi:hypothetical protein
MLLPFCPCFMSCGELRGEVEEVLALHLVDVGFGAARLERRKHGPVGAERAEGPVVAHVVQVPVERGRKGDPRRRGVDHRRRGNDAVAGGGELRLPDAGLVRGVLAVDAHAVGPDAALAVEQDRRGPPFAVDLNLLNEIDARRLGHAAIPWQNRRYDRL